MGLPMPRPPRFLLALAVLLWLGFTAAAVGVDGNGDDAKFAHDVLATLAAAAFAVAGVGGLLPLWQQREWRRRTQWVPFNLIEHALRETTAIAAGAAQIVRPANRSEQDGAGDVYHVFSVPRAPVRDELAESVRVTLGGDIAAAVRGADTHDEAAQVGRRAGGLRTDLEERGERLWSLTHDLAPYAGDVNAPRLLSEVSTLLEGVRNLSDPFPNPSTPEFARKFVSAALVTTVFDGCVTVCSRLDNIYRDVRRRVSDEGLETKLQQDESRVQIEDAGIAENLKIERETKQLLEAAEAAERSFDESWDVLQTQVRALLDSDTVTSDVLNDIKQRLQRLGERAEEIEEELKRADEAPPPST
jgi:hypothetical protein